MSGIISKFITKIFLVLLIIIMIAGVAVWGINDILIGSSNKKVATVGNYNVSSQELEQAVQNQKFQLAQSGISNLSDDLIASIRNNSLFNLIADRLMRNEFDNLGLELNGKDVLKQEYLSQPDFNKEQLQAVIRSFGGEEAFLKKITQEKKIDILQGAITGILPATDVAVRNFYNSEKQTRNINYVSAGVGIIKNSSSATPEDLKKFYEENKERFISPETRKVSYIIIDENAIADKTAETDIVTALHEVSGEILDEVASGKTLEEIAKDYNLTLQKISSIDQSGMDNFGKPVSNLPAVNNFIESVFSTDQEQISDILESDDGKKYGLLRIDSIKEKSYRNYEDVKDLVKYGFETQFKAGELVKKISQLKQDLDSGKTTLERFAMANGINVETENDLTLDSTKFSKELVQNIFNTNKNNFTEIARDQQGNLIIAEVKNITLPQAPTALESFTYKNKLDEQLSEEIMAQYLDYLRSKYEVK